MPNGKLCHLVNECINILKKVYAITHRAKCHPCACDPAYLGLGQRSTVEGQVTLN
jgi:hypothetical protein